MHETNQPDIATLVYHELRAPLGLVATLARGASCEDDVDELRRQCALIQRTAERMLRTASAVIETARATRCDDAGWFAPLPIVQRAVDDAAPAGLRVRLLQDAAVDRVSIYGSPMQLETLLHSLLANALDHGDPAGNIMVSVGVIDGQFSCTVRNPVGHGRGHRGIGAGIVVCRQLVRALGGEMATWREGEDFLTSFAIPAGERAASPVEYLVPA